MPQSSEYVRQAVSDLLSDLSNKERQHQANYPIANGTSSNSKKIWSYYQNSPHLTTVFHQARALGETVSGNGINRAGHIRGSVHEGTSHIYLRALLQEGGGKSFIVFSPETTSTFNDKFRKILLDNPDQSIPPQQFQLSADMFIVNTKKMIAKEDIECTLRKGQPMMQVNQPSQISSYFDSKQNRFNHAQEKFPSLFSKDSVCRFVLTRGRTVPNAAVPARNTPYTTEELDRYVASMIQNYSPQGSQNRPLIYTCAELGQFVGSIR